MEATELQRGIGEPWTHSFFTAEVVGECQQVFTFPSHFKETSKSHVISYLIKHWLKFRKIWCSFILIFYSFLVWLFLDLSALSLRCCPESLSAAVTLDGCPWLFLLIVFDGHSRPMRQAQLVLYWLFCRWEHWGPWKRSAFLELTQMVSDRTVIRTRNSWLPSMLFTQRSLSFTQQWVMSQLSKKLTSSRFFSSLSTSGIGLKLVFLFFFLMGKWCFLLVPSMLASS